MVVHLLHRNTSLTVMDAKFCRHRQADLIMLFKQLLGDRWAEVFKESRNDQALKMNRLRILATVKRAAKKMKKS